MAEDDPEVKVTTHHLVIGRVATLIDELQKRNSSWSRVKRVMGYIIHFTLKLKKRIGKVLSTTILQPPLDVATLEDATRSIICQI